MLTNCFYAAAFAWVFSNVLTTEGNVLAFYGRWLEMLYQRRLTWLAKPLGWCGKCLSGQLALWTYPLWGAPANYGGGLWIDADAPPMCRWMDFPGNWACLFSANAYHPVAHALAVTNTILFYIAIESCLNKSRN
jgi:hypothetical protein